MKKLIVLFIGILAAVQVYGQEIVRETYPTVSFNPVDARGDSAVITKSEQPNNFELYYEGKKAGVLSTSVYWDTPNWEFGYGSPKNNPSPRCAQAWMAWLCYRVIPEEVREKLDTATRYEDNIISYLLVHYELEIKIRIDKSGKIIQVNFFFQNRDLYQAVTDEQLKAMYKGIMKNCRLIEGIYRLPNEGVEAEEFQEAETYVLDIWPNSSFRWILESKKYCPEVWEEALKYFDSLKSK